MAGHQNLEEDEFVDGEVDEETQELMHIIFGEPEEWDDVIETAPKQMRQACRVAKDKAAALRRYCIEAGLLKLPVRAAKLGKSRQASPKEINRKRRSLETSLQKLFAKGRNNGTGVEEFVWGISYADGSTRIGSDEVLAPIWQKECYMEKVRQKANDSKLTAGQFKDNLRSVDLSTLLSKHLTVPERKAAVTSLGPVCVPPMAVTSFNAAFGLASGRLSWWPSAVPLSKAWKLKSEETIVVLEAMAQNIVTHFGAGTSLSQEEQKRGCLETFKRCVVGPHVAAGLKGSGSEKVVIFELIGEKATATWQLPETGGQEGCQDSAPEQPSAPRRVRRTKAQMGPQPFPCEHCVGEYSTAAALKAHRCKARRGAQPGVNNQSEAPRASAEPGAPEGGATAPGSNGGGEVDGDDGVDGAFDELVEEMEKDAQDGATGSPEPMQSQAAAAEFLRSVQAFATPYQDDANAPLHLLQLLSDLLDQGNIDRKVLQILHTMQGVGNVSTRLCEAGLDQAVPTDTLLVDAHTETVVRHLRAGSGNWPKFIEECELLEDLAGNMGGVLLERWSRFQRAIVNPSLVSELLDKFDRSLVLGNLRAYVARANRALGSRDESQETVGQSNGAASARPELAQSALRSGGRACGISSAQPGGVDGDGLSSAQRGGKGNGARNSQPGGEDSNGIPSAQAGGAKDTGLPSSPAGGGEGNGAPCSQTGGEAGRGVPSAQPEKGTRVLQSQPGGENRNSAPSAQAQGKKGNGSASAQTIGGGGNEAPSAQSGRGKGNEALQSQPGGKDGNGEMRNEALGEQLREGKGSGVSSTQPGGRERNGVPRPQRKWLEGGGSQSAPEGGAHLNGSSSAQEESEGHARLPPRPASSPSASLLKRKVLPQRESKGRGKKTKVGDAGTCGLTTGGGQEDPLSQAGCPQPVASSNRPPRRVASAGVSQILKELTNGLRR